MILKFDNIDTLNIFKRILVFFNHFDPLINMDLYFEDDYIYYEDLSNLNINVLKLSKDLFSEVNLSDGKKLTIPNALLLELKLLKKTKKKFPKITFYNIEKNGINYMIVETKYTNSEKTTVEIPLVKDKKEKIYILKYDNYCDSECYKFKFQIGKINNQIFSSVIFKKFCNFQLKDNKIIFKFFCSNNIIKTYEDDSENDYKNDEFIISFNSSFLKNILKIFDKNDFFTIIYKKDSNFIFIELLINQKKVLIVFKTECFKNKNIINNLDINKIYNIIDIEENTNL